MANKQDLIAKVAEATELTKKDSAVAVDAVFKAVTEFLAAGEKVQLIGFGNFEVRERAARKGRNPQTGKAKSKLLKFQHLKLVKLLKKQLNNNTLKSLLYQAVCLTNRLFLFQFMIYIF